MEPACKPGSVEDSHSSGIAVTGDFKRPTRKHGGTPAATFVATSLFGLAPGGVCRAVRVATSAVRSYRTVSPLPSPLLALGRFAFCCTFRRLTPPRGYLAPCPQEPGLSSTFREKCSDRPANSGAHDSGMKPFKQVAGRRPLFAFSGRRQLQCTGISIIAAGAGELRRQRGGL